MAIPDEYKLEGVTHKADNLVVHQASHPIHGEVSIYMVDDTLPTGIAVAV